MAKIVLTDWYLVLKSEPALNYKSKKFFAYLEGQRADMPGTFVRSKKIRNRIPGQPLLIRTIDNKIYELRSPFCHQIALLFSYPENLYEKFERGFPEDWLETLDEFYEIKTARNIVSAWDVLEKQAKEINKLRKLCQQSNAEKEPPSVENNQSTTRDRQFSNVQSTPDNQVAKVATTSHASSAVDFLSPILSNKGNNRKTGTVDLANPNGALPFNRPTSTPVIRKLARLKKLNDPTHTESHPINHCDWNSAPKGRRIPLAAIPITKKPQINEIITVSPTDTDAEILRFAHNKSREENVQPVASIMLKPKKIKKKEKRAVGAKKLDGVKKRNEAANEVFNRTRSGRLVKPRLNGLVGQRIDYDIRGNPKQLWLGDENSEQIVDLTKYAEELHVSNIVGNNSMAVKKVFNRAPNREAIAAPSKVKASLAQENQRMVKPSAKNRKMDREAPSSWTNQTEIRLFKRKLVAVKPYTASEWSNFAKDFKGKSVKQCQYFAQQYCQDITETAEKENHIKAPLKTGARSKKTKENAPKIKFSRRLAQKQTTVENNNVDQDMLAPEIMMLAQNDKGIEFNLLEPDNLSLATTPGSLAGFSRLLLGSEVANSTGDSTNSNESPDVHCGKRQKDAVRYVHEIQKAMPKRNLKTNQRFDKRSPLFAKKPNLKSHFNKVDKLLHMENDKRNKLKRFRLESSSDEESDNNDSRTEEI